VSDATTVVQRIRPTSARHTPNERDDSPVIEPDLARLRVLNPATRAVTTLHTVITADHYSSKSAATPTPTLAHLYARRASVATIHVAPPRPPQIRYRAAVAARFRSLGGGWGPFRGPPLIIEELRRDDPLENLVIWRSSYVVRRYGACAAVVDFSLRRRPGPACLRTPARAMRRTRGLSMKVNETFARWGRAQP